MKNGTDQKSRLLKDMDYLVKELGREWEQSKKTMHTVRLYGQEAGKIRRQIQEKINACEKVLTGRADLSLKAGMRYSKDSYIVLRLGRKLTAGQEAADAEGVEEITLELDKEEYKLLREFLRNG